MSLFKNDFINKGRFLIMRGVILSIRENYCVNKKDSLLIRGRGVIRGFQNNKVDFFINKGIGYLKRGVFINNVILD